MDWKSQSRLEFGVVASKWHQKHYERHERETFHSKGTSYHIFDIRGPIT